MICLLVRIVFVVCLWFIIAVGCGFDLVVLLVWVFGSGDYFVSLLMFYVGFGSFGGLLLMLVCLRLLIWLFG